MNVTWTLKREDDHDEALRIAGAEGIGAADAASLWPLTRRARVSANASSDAPLAGHRCAASSDVRDRSRAHIASSEEKLLP